MARSGSKSSFSWVFSNWRSTIRDMEFSGGDVRADLKEKYDYDGPLADVFVGNSSGVVHKWHHYIPLYDRYFQRFRGTPVRFLEIGVSKGGSLAMWRSFLGPEAIIFGIDIDPACKQYDGIAAQVRIGSQDDPAFLRSVVAEMGGIDLVLDDGSHQMRHVRATLACLFPMLSADGIYMIEDLHTAYWRKFGGGYSSSGNFFSDMRVILDDMHASYHQRRMKLPEISQFVSGMHVHDSILVLEKGPVHRPTHSRIGVE